MLLVNSTCDLVIEGIAHPNLPILVDSDMVVVNPVLKFIVYQAVTNGRVKSPKTVKNYADALYDYFSFLEANRLEWNSPNNKSQVSTVALYRNWSASLQGTAALKHSTINIRLTIIQLFYEFCFNKKMINYLPWEKVFKARRYDAEGFMRHTRSSTKMGSTTWSKTSRPCAKNSAMIAFTWQAIRSAA